MLFKPKILHRKRISKMLEGILDVPLFLLLASMGYGKTTAVRTFLSSKKNLRYVWFSLNTGEDDELWMWQRFCQSLEDISADLSRRLAGYGLPQSAVDRERILGVIKRIVMVPTVIVIDDYQENRSGALDRLITYIARGQVSNLHIVLISRSIPDIPIDELALKGLCIELSQDRFEFSREETVEMFAQNGFLLSSKEQKLLVKNTDGWVAAIYLTLLKYAEDNIVGDVQDITRLIKTAVYDKFDRETQQILIRLSLLDSFTLDGAVYVTGEKKVGRLIRKMITNNCFIRYDSINGTYSFHAILKAMLKEVFTVTDMDKAALYSRCGDWCVQCAKYIEAVDFYYRAECYDQILDIFELPGAAEYIDKAPHIIISAFNSMDEQAKLSRPLAYITYIYSYLVTIDAEAGAKMLYKVKEIYKADVALIDRDQILGEIALAESVLQFNDVPLMSQFHKKAYDLFCGNSSRISNPDAIFTFGSPHTLYLYHKKKGTLLSLVSLIENDNWYYTKISNGCGTGFEYTARAEYCLETGRLADAELFAYKAVFKSKPQNQLCLVICANLCLARLAVLSGRPQEAIDLLDALRGDIEATGSPILLNSIDIAEGYVYGVLGMAERIQKWLLDGDISQCNLFQQGMGINYIVIGKAAVLRKSYAELEVIAETMREIYAPNNHIFGLIYAGIYDAISKNNLYGMAKAREALLRAIDLAQADGIVMPFVENMPELEPIIQETKRIDDNEWLCNITILGERILSSLEQFNSQIEIENLTAREFDVLKLLDRGFTQKEMAEEFCLSRNTVRRHLQNIYGKLGVTNKTLALNAAKERKLIP